MGYKQSASVIVIAAALLLSAPLGYGQPPDSAIISGRICCTPTANCGTNTSGIPGLRVNLNCDSSSGLGLSLGEGITNINGVFSIIAGSIQGIEPIIDFSQCNVNANLPLRSTVCLTLNNVNGTLTGAPIFVGSTVGKLLNLISNLVVFSFDLSVA